MQQTRDPVDAVLADIDESYDRLVDEYGLADGDPEIYGGDRWRPISTLAWTEDGRERGIRAAITPADDGYRIGIAAVTADDRDALGGSAVDTMQRVGTAAYADDIYVLVEQAYRTAVELAD